MKCAFISKFVVWLWIDIHVTKRKLCRFGLLLEFSKQNTTCMLSSDISSLLLLKLGHISVELVPSFHSHCHTFFSPLQNLGYLPVLYLSKTIVNVSQHGHFLLRGVISTSPSPQVRVPPLVGWLRMLIQYFRSYTPYWDTRWRSWLRHCVTSRKVAGSIPDGVIGYFRLCNPSGRTMALGLTQPLTEMSTRSVFWG